MTNSTTTYPEVDNGTQSFLTTESVDTGTFSVSKGLVSKEQADIIIFVVYQILMPSICIVGIIGNLMSVAIIFKTKDSMAFNTYLKALTLFDTSVLFFGLVRFTCDIIAAYVTSIAAVLKAYTAVIISLVVGKYVWGVAQSLITIMSIERCVAVALPLHVKSFVLEKHPKAVILTVIFVQFLFRLPTMIWIKIESIPDSRTNGTLYMRTYREWAIDHPFRTEFWPVFMVIFDMLLPILVVLVMNAAILFFLKRRSKMFGKNIHKDSKRSADEKRLTITLLILSGFYLFSVAPNMTINAFKFFIPDYPSFFIREINLLVTILNINILLVTLNSANDSAIYILSSKKFRQMFKDKYFGWYRKLEANFQSKKKTYSQSTKSETESKSVTDTQSKEPSTSTSNFQENI